MIRINENTVIKMVEINRFGTPETPTEYPLKDVPQEAIKSLKDNLGKLRNINQP